MSKREVSNLLKAVVQALKELDESQYQQLLEGKGRIQFIDLEPRVTTGKSRKGKPSLKIRLNHDQLRVLAHQLQGCQTREEARELLVKDNRVLLKDTLAQLARLLGIYINKDDRREAIEDKIVEFVVGTRLRSEAIMSLNLKGSGYSREGS